MEGKDTMTAEQMLAIVSKAAKLKTTFRHCYTEEDRRESVADHSWRIALMAMLLYGEEEFRSVDMDKVIRMCLIHDLGEAFTGDIPTFLKTGEDEDAEDKLFRAWVDGFPEPQKSEWKALLAEMKALESAEAKTWKALDKLEAVISHDESDIGTWLPLEYELQLSHGKEDVQFFDFLRELKEAIDGWTRAKIRENESSHRTQ